MVSIVKCSEGKGVCGNVHNEESRFGEGVASQAIEAILIKIL